MVRPKKYLGQHFLKDQNIAAKIVEALQLTQRSVVLEIGPGTGVLTGLLMQRPEVDLYLSEIDRESVAYLKEHFASLREKIFEGDFIKLDMSQIAPGKIHIIGNFPYNISSQIFFQILNHHEKVDQVVCMLQKEVADRLAEKEGSKTYGILSVLLQTFYTIESKFKVPPGVFHPPPKVMSAVIRLVRNHRKQLPCEESLFRKVVKQAFQNRRKTLRNALKPLNLPGSVLLSPFMDKRAEQLSVENFISLTTEIEMQRGADY
ncbi:MAG: 16S rRNA (adenine(1518)-N(6)/adenine(1519)-N(6))-dimethyltransferase RsmA [Bacteroidetes bacterium]|nr:16S rRNA (adenine(1518)-N(6)/adenine(1519)-N(6))-dimethyltransferase RsmA [Bacteroidota bacterium]